MGDDARDERAGTQLHRLRYRAERARLRSLAPGAAATGKPAASRDSDAGDSVAMTAVCWPGGRVVTSGLSMIIGRVPRISAFYGILITMYFLDHPPPHFHAAYAGHVAQVEIESLAVLDGWLPPRALRLVAEWGE